MEKSDPVPRPDCLPEHTFQGTAWQHMQDPQIDSRRHIIHTTNETNSCPPLPAWQQPVFTASKFDQTPPPKFLETILRYLNLLENWRDSAALLLHHALEATHPQSLIYPPAIVPPFALLVSPFFLFGWAQTA